MTLLATFTGTQHSTCWWIILEHNHSDHLWQWLMITLLCTVADYTVKLSCSFFFYKNTLIIDIWLFLQTNWGMLKLTSMIKSVKGLRLSSSSWLLQSSRLYLTRNRARVFSSLETLSRMSIFSTSSGLWKRAARMVMGLGEWSLAFRHTRFISSTLPSGGKPEEEQKQQEWFLQQLQKLNKLIKKKLSHLYLLRL